MEQQLAGAEALLDKSVRPIDVSPLLGFERTLLTRDLSQLQLAQFQSVCSKVGTPSLLFTPPDSFLSS